MRTDITLPRSPDQERNAIGSMLLDRDAAAIAIEMLRPEDFYATGHRVLFETARKVFLERDGLDTALLRTELDDKLGSVGGNAYLVRVVDEVPTSAHVEHYCQHVLDLAERRRIATKAMAAADAALDTGMDMERVREGAAQVVQEIGGRVDDISGADCLDAAYEHLDHPDVRPRPKTHLLDLDAMLGGGLAPGELTIVASRPGIGKSAFCGHVALEAARAKMQVALWSLEMNPQQLGTRWLAAESGLSLHNRSVESLGDDAGRVMKAYDTLKPIFAERVRVLGGNKIETIQATMRRLTMRRHMDLAVVDYAQLVVAPGGNREQEIAAVSRSMKNAARQRNVPVLLVSQLNRLAEGAEPQLHHLRESGAQEADADVVLLLWWEDQTARVMNVKVAKNRTGPTGLCKVKIDLAVMGFAPLYRGAPPAGMEAPDAK